MLRVTPKLTENELPITTINKHLKMTAKIPNNDRHI